MEYLRSETGTTGGDKVSLQLEEIKRVDEFKYLLSGAKKTLPRLLIFSIF